ncbi:phosphoribosylanthranilate isomerase [Prosthecochloris sp. ZM_2]|uniref:phosphoribosylanthranilate isomerase n=1 Tax=Prosthecochloris sp. ZM_2 TaxID=2045206 RepID=UPI000DF73D37|nr:phosphoribosylanthranilate isomerase [Prosthecochloris sp. ZM_2]RNA65134.1 phosphoribosylanthranilate isomerase [Prosthecochloris sp. ZM_2]
MTRIKICGITKVDDALAAAEAGVHALGFNFSPSSPRAVTPEKAERIIAELPPFISTVGIFVEHSPEEINRICSLCRLHYAQLHSDAYTAERSRNVRAPGIIRVFRPGPGFSIEEVEEYRSKSGISSMLFDAYKQGQAGGTGERIGKRKLEMIFSNRSIAQRALLAGGLTPDNVVDAILSARPYGVDTASGVESSPGRKDHEKIRAFITAVHDADRLQDATRDT